MIKKIGCLTYNELIKQVKKTSVKVIIALILVVSILLPLGINFINADSNKNNENNSVMFGQTKSNIEGFENDKTEAGKINLAIAQSEVEYWKMMEENGIGVHDKWKEIELKEYQQNSIEIFAIKEILNGIKKDILLKNIHNVDNRVIEEYYNLSKEELNKKLNEINIENEKIKNIVLNNEYLKHIDKQIKLRERYIKEENETIKELEKSLKQDSKNKELINALNDSKKRVLYLEKSMEIDKYRYENKIDFERENWKNKTLLDIEELQQELNMEILTEDQFKREASMDSITVTYSEYQEQFRHNQKEMQEKIDRDWYSLKNDLPQLQFLTDARSIINGTYEVFIMLTVLIIIIIASGIVSSEFSKGTIRLLLIRPVSRWKILLSKLLAVLIIAYGMLISSLAVLTITSGAIFGFNTLKTSVIQTVAGKIAEISYIQYILPKILISSTSLVFIIAIAFMISTLVKNTALAVSASTILYLGAMPLTIMLATINMSWVGDTLIPYINQSMFNLAPSFIELLKIKNGVSMNYTFGSVQLLIVSLIMLVITFLIFSKKDIKN